MSPASRTQARDPKTGPRGFFVLDDPDQFGVGGFPQRVAVERQHADEQLVENHTQGVDVGGRVDVEAARVGLFRAHVLGRADEHAVPREDGLLGQPLVRRLRNPEVDDLRDRAAVLDGHEHVRRLEVAMDDALLVGVLDGLADRDEQREPFAGGQPVAIAVVGDRNAGHVLHHEVRPALVGRARVEHPGDVRVGHHREGLPLGVEPGHHLAGVHPDLDHLQGDLAADRVLLFRKVDHAHPALTEDGQDPVGANPQRVRADRP